MGNPRNAVLSLKRINQEGFHQIRACDPCTAFRRVHRNSTATHRLVRRCQCWETTMSVASRKEKTCRDGRDLQLRVSSSTRSSKREAESMDSRVWCSCDSGDWRLTAREGQNNRRKDCDQGR